MEMARHLATWFAAHARKLPWRVEPRDPYAVLVSELMLQQTQVSRVAERFPAFLERFPSLAALAAAGEAEVVAAWSGLGYYRRARALHRISRVLDERGEGLPSTARELERLPGIGPYTAAAVASLAHGEAVPVLDGNVLRVGARVLALDGDPRSAAGRRAIASWVRGLMDHGTPAVVNEGLMELGATVCTPVSPGCGGCPLGPACAVRAAGRQEDIPPPRFVRATERHRWVAAIAIDSGGRWLLRRIDEGDVLRGLWLPPCNTEPGTGEEIAVAASLLPFAVEGGVALPPVRHAITYRRIEVLGVIFETAGARAPGEGWRWEYPGTPGVPTSSLLGKLAEAARRRAAAGG
ncbi:MAG: A/G-specific adenine glycosylase [Acidobacteria bacterium]|nr:A/G-specific adenine glycosylase [Acidobacteriota bacterium]